MGDVVSLQEVRFQRAIEATRQADFQLRHLNADPSDMNVQGFLNAVDVMLNAVEAAMPHQRAIDAERGVRP